MASFKIEFTPEEKGKSWEMSEAQLIDLGAAICRAGGAVVQQHMRRTSPHTHLTPFVRATRVYFTPSDGAINQKIYFGGYLPLRKGRKYWLRYNKRGGKAYKTTEGVAANALSIWFYKGRHGNPFPIRDAFLRNIPKKAVEAAMLNTFNKEMEKLNKE